MGDAVPLIAKATTLKDIEVEVVETEVEETPMAQVTNLNANCVANLDIQSRFAIIGLIYLFKQTTIPIPKPLLLQLV